MSSRFAHRFRMRIGRVLRAALVAMDEQNPELRDRVFTSRLVEVDAAAHLGSLKDSVALAKRGSE